jgi:signal transduction histidine kinase
MVLARNLANRAGVIIDNARLYAASRKAARDLKQANRAKDEFLGLMSHELRTPITTIYGNAQVLQRLAGELDREAIAGALDDIKHDSERLHLMIENLLALARYSDRGASDLEPILVARVLDRLRRAHLRSYPHRQIEIEVDDAGVCAAANPTYLELVLRNLLNNAEKYSPQTQPVDVTLTSGATEVVVTVLDRGPGISEAEVAQVFQPFFRSETMRAAVPGVGIGLTVCKRLVEGQGGRIWVQPRPGGGTSVSFALPLESAG